jgi:hemoglobin-like flavoprotein
MTPMQIETVKTSFARIRPIANQAGILFYERLFEVDPELRPLFKGDIRDQSRKLMTMLGTVVDGLNDIDDMVPAIEALGRRHRDYRIKDADYATVGQALLWTLEQGLGDAFTPDVREAWAAAYDLVATTMQKAASKSDSSSPAAS